MPDQRSRIQKLRAMANQTASPQEAEIAKRILADLGEQAGVGGDPETLSYEDLRSAFESAWGDFGKGFAEAFRQGMGQSWQEAAKAAEDLRRSMENDLGFTVETHPDGSRTATWSGSLQDGAPIAAMIRAVRGRDPEPLKGVLSRGVNVRPEAGVEIVREFPAGVPAWTSDEEWNPQEIITVRPIGAIAEGPIQRSGVWAKKQIGIVGEEDRVVIGTTKEAVEDD